MQITNRFDKACCKCGVNVPAGAGFAAKPDNGKWNTYCSLHAPEQIQVRAVVSERKLASDGYITMPYEPQNNALLKTLPIPAGCRSAWDPDRKQWRASTAEKDRARVLEIADRLGLNVDPTLRGLSDLDQVAILPDSLYPFQKTGVEWLARRDRGLLADDMGLGKTVQAILSLHADDRAMVVCPASLKYNWEKEIKIWAPHLTPKVVNASDGKFPVPQAGSVVILNYEALPKWLLLERDAMPAAVSKLEGITLICDEAHFLGNKKSQRSRKVTMLSEQFAKRVLFLTGTAMTRDPNSMWDVLSAAGLAKEAFGSKTRFYKLFGATFDRWNKVSWGQPDPIVPELLRRVVLRRTRSEVLPDLPSKTYTDIVVNGLSTSLRSTLDSIWSDQGDFLETEDCLPGFEEFSKVRKQLADAKVPALLEMLDDADAQNVPLVVFSDHLGPVDACGARPGWAVIKGGVSPLERQNIVDAFQAGTLKGVALTTQAGGVGITLTRAWKMIQVDLNWTPAVNAQAEDRLVRIGQQASAVEIVRLVVDHPLERHIHGIVTKKTAMAVASIENSVAAQKLTAPKGAVNGALKSETQQEYDDRMEAIRLAAEAAEAQAQADAAQGRVARAKSKVEGILERERVRNPRNEQPMSAARIQSIRDGMAYMNSVCDGAVQKDNQGFNKADSYTGKTLAVAGLQSDDELRCGEYILQRYPRQWTLVG